MNQTEIDELRRLHEAATPGPWRWRINRSSKTAEIETPKEGGWTIMGFERWGMDGACPSFRMEQNGHSLLTRADQMAVDIPGREHHSEWFQGIDNDDANLMTSARNALPRLLAALEEARAERDEARSLLLNGIQTNGDSLAFLEHVRREHAAVVAERDAIKATLAKLAESERAWCELATARGAKLEALAEASNALIEGIDEFSSDHTTRYETCLDDLDNLREALAAAKVQP